MSFFHAMEEFDNIILRLQAIHSISYDNCMWDEKKRVDREICSRVINHNNKKLFLFI